MKTTSIEILESRVLFNVTLTNGLTPGLPNYYEVDLGPGGGTRDVILGSTDTVYDYFAYVDTGVASTGTFTRVQNLHSIATDPVLDPDTNVARSTATISILSATNPNAAISVEILSTVLPGETRLTTTYNFSALGGFDLSTVKVFQYLDSDVGAVNDDVLTVDGTIANNNLVLGTIDQGTLINAAQRLGVAPVGAALTGWSADDYPVLQNAILAGGYASGLNGTINLVALPAGNFPGIGPGYGPNDITTALQYQFSSIVGGSIQTVLGTTIEGINGPIIEVLGNGTIIADGDSTPNLNDLTNFTQFNVPATETFTIRNRGTETLSLNGSPLVQILGENAADFSVVAQPTEFVGAGFTSNFQIQFVPTGGGVRSATVHITSNDPVHTPYDFVIQGGSGATVFADAFENDNTPNQAAVIATNGSLQNHSINQNTDVDWATFTITQPANVVIETNGNTGDTVLDLYGPDSQKTLVTSDDNAGNREFSKITTVLQPGQYWTRVAENGSNARIAAYTLSVLASSSAPFATLGSDGVLRVVGTELSDDISLGLAVGNYSITRNGETLFFSSVLVTSISIDGGDGNDSVQLAGGVPAALILGGTGDDVITGGDGDDTIDGGVGNDVIHGGTGADLIYGRAGIDVIQGQLGADTIFGGADDDSIQGGQGKDSILGEQGNDTLLGYAGNDTLGGGKGDDSVDGGLGDDSLTGGLGNDFLSGSSGNDSLNAVDGISDTIDGGDGVDQALLDPSPIDLTVGVETPIFA